MFRISQFMNEIKSPTPVRPKRNPPGPVVIWNLIRRCNLACLHCYTNSTDRDYSGELNTQEVFSVMDDLKFFRVPVLILSGGEPLLRPDIYDISARAKKMGFYVGLSTNGTFIDSSNIDKIAALNFNYVGISLDGIGETHDRFRRKTGSFQAALEGIRVCKSKNLKVGIRFTLTQENAQDLPALLEFQKAEHIDKFYLSHLNYSGRGKLNRGRDAHFEITKWALDLLFKEAWQSAQREDEREFVTGNNDADGVYLLFWVRNNFPEMENHIRAKLAQWGGNSSGVNIANIDNLGNVHPDSFWWDYTLGNIRERPFSQIWTDLSDPLMKGLKAEQRQISGRCGQCSFFDVCNGNTRVRAYQVHKDAWAEDPGCYLDDNELGLTEEKKILSL
ncbi:MAG: heme d1 biosynthesis radical SAM protein NirJ [Bdellovibrionales bacterium]|nr:heme d1 biosynthesis radical SAM protein NirJ [Bdellovibrionales bacterium]